MAVSHPYWTEKPIALPEKVIYKMQVECLGYSSAAPEQFLLWKHKSNHREAQQGPDGQVSQFPPVQEEEEGMTGGIPVLRSMVLVRKAASQTEQRASITLSPIPESLVSSSKNQLGISKSHAWAEFSSQGQQRGDVLSNFLTAFISFNSSCPTHMCSMGYSKLH